MAAQERVRDRIRQLDRLRADFIANTSHELRSPLTVMRDYVDVLQDHWGELDDSRRREMLGKAGLGLVRLERLVADLLLVSRLEAGMLSLRADPVDMRGIVQEVAAEIATAHPGQVLTIEAALAPSVIGDRERLRQILTNLVDNAVKFSPVGAPVALRIGAHHGRLAVAVINHGSGIAPAAREHIFQRFGTAGSVLRPGAVGTGLGLYICKALAEVMDAKIELVSATGMGSTFILALGRDPTKYRGLESVTTSAKEGRGIYSRPSFHPWVRPLGYTRAATLLPLSTRLTAITTMAPITETTMLPITP